MMIGCLVSKDDDLKRRWCIFSDITSLLASHSVAGMCGTSGQVNDVPAGACQPTSALGGERALPPPFPPILREFGRLRTILHPVSRRPILLVPRQSAPSGADLKPPSRSVGPSIRTSIVLRVALYVPYAARHAANTWARRHESRLRLGGLAATRYARANLRCGDNRLLRAISLFNTPRSAQAPSPTCP